MAAVILYWDAEEQKYRSPDGSLIDNKRLIPIGMPYVKHLPRATYDRETSPRTIAQDLEDKLKEAGLKADGVIISPQQAGLDFNGINGKGIPPLYEESTNACVFAAQGVKIRPK